jgi:tetratricopeptide (TPR) repeat protein
MNTSFVIRLGSSFVMLVATSLAGTAQTPQQRLTEAYVLEKGGKPVQAVEKLHALLEARALDAFGTGKAWNILGLAYGDEGELQLARRAYEESIRILEHLPNTRDYAMALDGMGAVYVAAGDFQAADKLRVKALGLYEQAGDHGGIALAATSLAASAFRQNKMSRGDGYMARALKEARVATDLDGEDRAAIVSLEGWKAVHDGEFRTGVAKYRQALDLCRKADGEEHPSTGWARVLLGEADESAGELSSALAELKQGVDTLDRSLGRENRHFLLAELAYARVLDASGSHAEATRIRATAEAMLKDSDRRQCLGCSVSAMALR